MRKFTLLLLLATTAVPAMAQRGDDDDRQSRRSAQSDQSESRPQRAERAERAERPQRQMQVERRIERQEGNGGFAGMRQRAEQQQQAQQQRQVQQQVEVQQQGQSDRRLRYLQRRGDQQAQGGGLVPRQGRYRSIPDINPQIGQQPQTSRDGRVSTRHYRGDSHRWTNHWRNDRRYDWRRYRDRNRSVFQIGFYYDPFGYNYRRYSLGSFLYPSYYQSNFWINDPWQYRLPPAYGPYRWVRYHNDALLIDTYSGEVVDVIHGFFW